MSSMLFYLSNGKFDSLSHSFEIHAIKQDLKNKKTKKGINDANYVTINTHSMLFSG